METNTRTHTYTTHVHATHTHAQRTVTSLRASRSHMATLPVVLAEARIGSPSAQERQRKRGRRYSTARQQSTDKAISNKLSTTVELFARFVGCGQRDDVVGCSLRFDNHTPVLNERAVIGPPSWRNETTSSSKRRLCTRTLPFCSPRSARQKDTRAFTTVQPVVHGNEKGGGEEARERGKGAKTRPLNTHTNRQTDRHTHTCTESPKAQPTVHVRTSKPMATTSTTGDWAMQVTPLCHPLNV